MDDVKRSFVFFLSLIFLTSCLLSDINLGNSRYELNGPNIDELVFSLLPQFGFDEESDMLRTKQADFIPSISNFDLAENLTKNPDLNVFKSPKGTTRTYYLFFNCRKSPFKESGIRKAVAHLVNRNYICETFLKGWAEPIKTFAPPLSNEWTNFNATAPDFSSVKAVNILNSLGYKLDNSTGKRIDPDTGKYLEIKVLTPTRSEDNNAWIMGYTIAYYLNAVGLNATHISLSDYLFREKTMRERDFDICILETTLARTPFGLYAYFHSSRDKNWTYAYTGIHDPQLDNALERLWFGIEKSEVIKASKEAQFRLSLLIPCVPICSIHKISAISSKWVGITNMPGYGVQNLATYLNIHLTNENFGGRLVQTAVGGASTLNPCLARGANEWNILQLIYSPLFTVDPATMEDTPFLAEEWNTEPWVENKKNGMKITFKLAKGVNWQDGYPFTSEDVKFCIDYLKKNEVPRYSYICEKIVEVKTPSDQIVEIYLNETGYRLIYEFSWMTFTPKHIWKDVDDYRTYEPWNEPHPNIKGLTKLIGQGPFILQNYDQKERVKLVWNPTFFLKNPDKPPLVERLSTQQSVTYGGNVTIRYRVLNYTRSELHEDKTTFTFKIISNNKTLILEQKPVFRNQGYEVLINTEKIGLGEYTCEFKALPYGFDTFQLRVVKETKTDVSILSSPILIIAIIFVAGIVALIVFIFRKQLKNQSLNPKNQ